MVTNGNMSIFICGFEEKYTHEMEALIHKKLCVENVNPIGYQLKSCSVKKLLRILDERLQCGLYFIPIKLTNEAVNGITLGLKIRMRDPLAKIVYITTHIELIFLIIHNKIEVLDILLKNDVGKMELAIHSCIIESYERTQFVRNETRELISIQSKGCLFFFRPDSVYYFETGNKPHQVCIHTKEGDFEFYGKMKEIVEWNAVFYRCHKSFIVNVMNITLINKKMNEITFINGSNCYYSVKYQAGFLKRIKSLES